VIETFKVQIGLQKNRKFIQQVLIMANSF